MAPPLVWQLPLKNVPELVAPPKAAQSNSSSLECLQKREARFVKQEGSSSGDQSQPRRWRRPLAKHDISQGVIFFPLAPTCPPPEGGGSSSSTCPVFDSDGGLDFLWASAPGAAKGARPTQQSKPARAQHSGNAKSAQGLPKVRVPRRDGSVEAHGDDQPSGRSRAQQPVSLPQLNTNQVDGDPLQSPQPSTSELARPRGVTWKEASGDPRMNPSASRDTLVGLDMAAGELEGLIDPTDEARAIWRGEELDEALAERRERFRLTALHRWESAKAFGKAGRRKARKHSERLKEIERAERAEVLAHEAEQQDNPGDATTPATKKAPSRTGTNLPPLSRLPTNMSDGGQQWEAGGRVTSRGGLQSAEQGGRQLSAGEAPSGERPLLTRLKLTITRRSRARMIRSLRRKRRRQLEQLHKQGLQAEEDNGAEEQEGADGTGETNHVGHRKRRRTSVWAMAFAKMQEDNQLHRDDASRALEMAGFASINSDLVEEVYGRVTQFVTMQEAEFMHFCKAFDERLQSAYAEAFRRWDADGSGYLDYKELGELFKSFGIEPMQHVLMEVAHEVDEDGHGSVSLEEFRKVVDILIGRHGFSKKEYDGFVDIFSRFDRDGSGEMDAKELRAALVWLGYVFEEEKALAVLEEVDVNKSGRLDQREFMMCMRKVQQAEMRSIKEAIRRTDQDGDSSTITKQEIPLVFNSLGYFPDAEAVAEASRDVGLNLEESDLDLSEFWQLMTAFREKEGFGIKDIAEITEAFDHFDKNKTGEISTSDVPRTMRWVGWPMDFEAVQDLISKVNPERSGKIDMQQLQKLFRMQHEQDLDRARELFHTLAGTHDTIPSSQVLSGLETLGLLGKGKDMQQNTEGLPDNVNLQTFLHEVTMAKRFLRESQRARSGFTPEEIKELQDCFASFDLNNDGEIREAELGQLIEVMFPEMAHNAAMRGTLVQLLKDIDADGSGSIDFQDFLRLTSRLCEMQDAERHEREQHVIELTAFSQEEVDEFRSLFMEHDQNNQGGIKLAGAKSMIHAITPLGDVLAAQFAEIFKSITAANRTGRPIERSADEMDFPEFLMLMRKLLDMDFGRLKSKTARLGSSQAAGRPAAAQ